MSSPAILTWVEVPREVAFRNNSAFCEELLQRCRETLPNLEARARELAQLGRTVPGPNIGTFEQMEQAMRELLVPETSDQALALIHEYYQQMKHPWIERMDAAEEDLAKEKGERDERLSIAKETGISAEAIAAARASAIAALSGPVKFHQRQVRDGGIAEVGTAIETPGEARRRVETELCVLAAGNGRMVVAEQLLAEHSGQEDKTALVHLQRALLEEGRRTHERLAEQASAREVARHRQQVLENLAIAVKSIESLLQIIPRALAHQYRQRIVDIADSAGGGDADTAWAEFLLVQRAVTDTGATGEKAFQLVHALEAQGYKQIGALETIRVGDIQKINLGIPGHPERVLEVSWDARHQALSTEVVRITETTGSAAQVDADRKAQTKSCADLRTAIASLGTAGGLALARETKPGEKMKHRADAAVMATRRGAAKQTMRAT